MEKFHTCSCFFRDNIFLEEYKLHVRFVSENQFRKDYQNVSNLQQHWLISSCWILRHFFLNTCAICLRSSGPWVACLNLSSETCLERWLSSGAEITPVIMIEIKAVRGWLFIIQLCIYRSMQKSKDARVMNWNQQREHLPLGRCMHLYISMFTICRYLYSVVQVVYNWNSFTDILQYHLSFARSHSWPQSFYSW